MEDIDNKNKPVITEEVVNEDDTEFDPLAFENVSLSDMSLFVIDTETTGSQGVPFWYSQNQVIQLAMFDLETKGWYDRYTKPVDDLSHFFIPLENQQKHRISKKVLQSTGISLKTALIESREFKQGIAAGRRIVNIAHNAQFDYDMLMKSWYEQCDVTYGLGCSDDEEHYFDTLSAFKHFYPEIGQKVLARDAPYKLSNLVKYFIPDLNMESAHNATVDTVATAVLFVRYLLPKLSNDFSKWTKFLVSHPLHRPNPPVLTLLIDIDGYSVSRVQKLARMCNEYFATFHESEIRNLRVPDGFMIAGKLLSYAHLKSIYERDSKRLTTVYPKIMVEGVIKEVIPEYDSYYEICKTLETALRGEQFGIYSDRVICSLLSHVCNCTLLDFTMHIYRISGDVPLFPTMPGEPISYLPLNLTPVEAAYMNNVMGCRTISELYAQRKYLPENELIHWIRRFNAGMIEYMPMDTLQIHFDNVIKYGG